MTLDGEAADRVTVKERLGPRVALGQRDVVDQEEGVGSSLRIVPVPCASAIVALVGLLRLTKKVSFGLDGRVAVDRDGDGAAGRPAGAKVSVPLAAV